MIDASGADITHDGAAAAARVAVVVRARRTGRLHVGAIVMRAEVVADLVRKEVLAAFEAADGHIAEQGSTAAVVEAGSRVLAIEQVAQIGTVLFDCRLDEHGHVDRGGSPGVGSRVDNSGRDAGATRFPARLLDNRIVLPSHWPWLRPAEAIGIDHGECAVDRFDQVDPVACDQPA